jgi:hypothetical protein
MLRTHMHNKKHRLHVFFFCDTYTHTQKQKTHLSVLCLKKIIASFPIAEAGIVICYRDENRKKNYIAR